VEEGAAFTLAFFSGILSASFSLLLLLLLILLLILLLFLAEEWRKEEGIEEAQSKEG
jgi:hypothetical protein